MPSSPAPHVNTNGHGAIEASDGTAVRPESEALIADKKDPEADYPDLETKTRWPLLTSTCKVIYTNMHNYSCVSRHSIKVACTIAQKGFNSPEQVPV